MPTGTATLDFGAFPGVSDASVVITGQASIGAGSIVEAFLRLEATVDHSADEHLVEPIKIMAGAIVPGVGFTIYGVNMNQINEPVGLDAEINSAVPTAVAQAANRTLARASVGGRGTRIYGQWSVAWVWV